MHSISRKNKNIKLSWIVAIYGYVSVELEILIGGKSEFDLDEIEPYIRSVIQADNMQMDNDEMSNLVKSLSNDLDKPTKEVREDRTYTLFYRDNKISLIISTVEKYSEFNSAY